jgi:hypothetical protein
MTEAAARYDADAVGQRIVTIRGQKVVLDTDLACLYGVPTKALNQAVKRNRTRFPEDFVFQLTAEEFGDLRSQIAALNQAGGMRPQNASASNRSQIVTLKRGQHRKYAPYAFTEHGAIMAASVLNSSQAVEMSVFVVRAFVGMREQLLATANLAKRLAEVETELLTHDAALRDLYEQIRPLLLPPPEPERKPIGFGVKERRAAYRVKRNARP